MCREALQKWVCRDLEEQVAVCKNTTAQLEEERRVKSLDLVVV